VKLTAYEDKTGFLITGGAGFIGSHLVDVLMSQRASVHALDNLSRGSLENIEKWLNDQNFMFVKGDLRNLKDIVKAMKGCEIVYHLAANPEVRISSVDPKVHFQQNVVATYNLLESTRKAGNVRTFVFASSSTIYGEPSLIPTPENYAPLEPISIYGASKLASEALIIAYAHIYGLRAIIYHLANIVGPRSRHGVIYDFIQRLRKKPEELTILGDGTQSKSYLYITDCIKTMLQGLEKTQKQVEIFNVGLEDQIDVKAIAKIVIEEMGLEGVKIIFTGGVDGGRGWKGDVKNMLLNISKLKSIGWKPQHKSAEAVRLTARALMKALN